VTGRPKRIVILAEGQLTFGDAKTAFGVIRYGTDQVVALVDRANAGRSVSEWIAEPHTDDSASCAAAPDLVLMALSAVLGRG
jgi:uncharacterized NAD-dependent epimerase/dehydratase family protein